MEKKTALITGSYGGLGTCFVNIHAGKGGDLILAGRSQSKRDEQAESVKKQYGVEAYTIAADLSQPDAAQMIYDIPELGKKLAGAVCDFTEPATGQNKLFFPVA